MAEGLPGLVILEDVIACIRKLLCLSLSTLILEDLTACIHDLFYLSLSTEQVHFFHLF